MGGRKIFPHFLLVLLWITDSYLNSPRNLHQMEMEKNVLEKQECHNDFYLHTGTERKHLGFGAAAIYSTLTSNPDRKNKPPNGRMDRRCMIFLYLLLSGDIELNPGPVSQSCASEKHFVDQHRCSLIKKVTAVDPILDLLLQEEVINNEKYQKVMSKSTTQEKMRELYTFLESSKAKDLFYKGLEEEEKLLLNELRDAQPSHPTQPERAAASSVSDLLVKTQEDAKPIEFYQNKLQTNVEDPFTCLPEGSVQRSDKEDFEDCYTHVSIIYVDNKEISCEHEVRQMERKKAWQDIPQSEMVMKKAGQEIQLSDIFKHPSGEDRRIRTVMSIGIAGVGKTFLVHKFVSDWAKKKHQHPHLTFVFQFRHLNLLQGRSFSLAQLIHECIDATKCIPVEALNDIFTKLQKSGNSNYDNSLFKLLFVFDGLDESFQLDFETNHDCSDDFSRPVPLEELLVNVMKGKLLRCAHIWITTRPAAAKQISQFVDMLMEVKGFTDAMKEEYFRKRFSDEKLASRINSHMKTSKSLHIMCEIPVFCSMAATVLHDILSRDETGQLPKTQTEMYSSFLMVQTKRKKQKYEETHERKHEAKGRENKPKISLRSLFDSFSLSKRKREDQQQLMKTDREVLLKLGRLAFEHLEKGSIIFYQEDLEKCDLDVKEASLYSGVCTEIFKGENLKFQRIVYSFVHLSIQEFLAAVYLFHCFTQKNRKVLKTFLGGSVRSLDDFLQSVMEKALKSKNGHLDLFVRFLHGLSLESNQSLLGGLLGQTENSPESIQRAINNLKKMTTEDYSAERIINIFHCLMEMNDHSVFQEIQRYLKSKTELSPTQCSALAFMLQMSEVLDEFYLDTYNTSWQGRQRLIPAVRNSRKARLAGCWDLKQTDYEVVSSALSSNPSHLTELEISGSKLKDPFMEILTAGLKSPHCRLQILRLVGCEITQTGFELLASALGSNPSHIKELDLSYSNLQESSVLELIFAVLKSPLCRLETLRLAGCNITQTGCEVLASALSSNLVRLKQLDLSFNSLHDSGLTVISTGLKSPHCILQILSLSGCEVTEEGCSSLASALTFNPSHLKQLDLNFNQPTRLTQLSDVVKSPHFGLETLSVNHGGEHWIKPQLLTRYFHRLTLDTNTAHRDLSLSENNREVTCGRRFQYPDHPDRFDEGEANTYIPQVVCTEGLTGRCYWEVEWSEVVSIAVTYRGINRKGEGEDCMLGWNDKSWSLLCRDDHYDNIYTVSHNRRRTVLPVRPSDDRVSAVVDRRGEHSEHSEHNVYRVSVYLDCSAGTLSFYQSSSETLRHLYTFQTTFTEPLYPGFSVLSGSVSLCEDRQTGCEDRQTDRV